MQSGIVPPNRWITLALALGLLALLIYGAFNRDPFTLIILLTLIPFLIMPALLLYSLNRRHRDQPPTSPTDDEDQPENDTTRA